MTMLAKLRHISHEPQHALPDVFLWLLQNNKRIAYHRIAANQLIYSPNDEEAGKNCASVQTLFLKVNTRLYSIWQLMLNTCDLKQSLQSVSS